MKAAMLSAVVVAVALARVAWADSPQVFTWQRYVTSFPSTNVIGLSESGELYGRASDPSESNGTVGLRSRAGALERLPRVNAWSTDETILSIDRSGRVFGRSTAGEIGAPSRQEDWYFEPGSTSAKPLGFVFAGVNRAGVVAGYRGQEVLLLRGAEETVVHRHTSGVNWAIGIADDETVSGIDLMPQGRASQWRVRNGVFEPLPDLNATSYHTGISPSGTLFGDTFAFGGTVGYTYRNGKLNYFAGARSISIGTFFDRDLSYVVGSDRDDYAYIWQNGNRYDLRERFVGGINGGFGIKSRVRYMSANGHILLDDGPLIYVVSPVPEPATLVASGVGMFMLARRRKHSA